jgi:hypothetical protein
MSGHLLVLVPYGNGYALNHFARGNGEGDVTLCGRECYGWSFVRDFDASDTESAYSCKRCLKALAKARSGEQPAEERADAQPPSEPSHG